MCCGAVIVVASDSTEVKLGAIEAGLDGREVGLVGVEVKWLTVESVEEGCREVVVSILC